VDSAQTHYKTLFDMLDATLSGQGSGNTSDSPHIILVLITDGAYTQIYNDGTMRPNAIHSINVPGAVNYYEVFAPSECQALIDQEYEMVVVNTIYDPLINSGRYDDLIKPYANEIDGNLEECATSSYFEASSTADIEVAFDELAEILGKSVFGIQGTKIRRMARIERTANNLKGVCFHHVKQKLIAKAVFLTYLKMIARNLW